MSKSFSASRKRNLAAISNARAPPAMRRVERRRIKPLRCGIPLSVLLCPVVWEPSTRAECDECGMLGAGFTVLNQLTGRRSDDRPNVGERLNESGLASSGSSRNDIASQRSERTSRTYRCLFVSRGSFGRCAGAGVGPFGEAGLVVVLVSGPGSDLSEEPVYQGVSRPRWKKRRPWVSSRTHHWFS